ncbi:MAG TPA: KamA family radical SAM protein [Spirochaetia bacterium]|nr:KamA family radical SAM protein [Spirochaetia bacterium]
MSKPVVDLGIDPITKLPYGVSRYYAGLADSTDPTSDPIAAQYIPQAEELITLPYESNDPIGDNRYRVADRLIHHYHDRALLLANDRCATYCRHCFRRHFTGHGGGRITETELDEACTYLRKTPQIREILLSGGDPLMLSDPEIERVIERLKSVRSDYTIRICTRLPVVLPSRITTSLCSIFERFEGLWAVIHTNHPREITEEFRRAVRMLTRAGVPVLNQAVLLRGINDDASILEELLRGLVVSGVKPYYLFQGDLAAGTAHFRVPIERGLALMQELRGRLSGIALPTYAVDLPDGGGKVPIESSLLRIEQDAYVLRGPGGREYRYPRELSSSV